MASCSSLSSTLSPNSGSSQSGLYLPETFLAVRGFQPVSLAQALRIDWLVADVPSGRRRVCQSSSRPGIHRRFVPSFSRLIARDTSVVTLDRRSPSPGEPGLPHIPVILARHERLTDGYEIANGERDSGGESGSYSRLMASTALDTSSFPALSSAETRLGSTPRVLVNSLPALRIE